MTMTFKAGSTFSTIWRQCGQDLLNLILPVECAGCGEWDTLWCGACADTIAEPKVRRELASAANLPNPVIAVGDYQGALRHLVLAAKHDSRRDLTRVVRQAGANCSALLPPRSGNEEVWFVPAPSGKKRRRSGRIPARELACGVARAAVKAGWCQQARVLDALVLAPQASPQEGLGRAARAANRRGQISMQIQPSLGSTRVAAVLVDDVITTGATMRACEAALKTSGIVTIARICLAGVSSPESKSTPGPAGGVIFQVPGRR